MKAKPAKSNEQPVGVARCLLEALSLCKDHQVMDRIWDLLDDVCGPDHVASTRRFILKSNPSHETLKMLHSRQQLYPLNDFASQLTTPGFIALAELVGPLPLVDESISKPCILVNWLTRRTHSLNSKQAVCLVDIISDSGLVDVNVLAKHLWKALFTATKLGYHNTSIEVAIARANERGATYLPNQAQSQAWLDLESYGADRHGRMVVDFMIEKVFNPPTVGQARAITDAALRGFRNSIEERDYDMAIESFKQKASMSLSPRKLSGWLGNTGLDKDPAILGMFLASRARASALRGKMATLAGKMMDKAMPPAIALDVEGARELVSNFSRVIMPPLDEISVPAPLASNKMEQVAPAWNYLQQWAQGLPKGEARQFIERACGIGTAQKLDKDSYSIQCQAVSMHVSTPVPAQSAPRPRRI